MAPYVSAVLLAVFSIMLVLLIIPPMWWHFRNRNIGATAVIAWIIAMDLIIFINAIIWPNDDFSHNTYTGEGLCDVEVKIQVASQIAFPASFACVLRALAAVMDTERASLGMTKAEKRRGYIIDALWCIGFPCLQMLFHFIVQPRRYYVWGVSGCLPAVSNTWVTVVLILIPPVLWTLLCAYYAILIIFRLHRYRRSFATLLANSNTNKSRFLRLFLLCLLWVFANVPIQFYVLYQNLITSHVPYSWADVHDPAQWRLIELVASGGAVVYDRYIWLSAGVVMFFFFGFGSEAVGMYRAGIKAIGLENLVPHTLKESIIRPVSAGGATVASFSSKARLLLFSRKSTSTLTTLSEGSTKVSASDAASPQKASFTANTKPTGTNYPWSNVSSPDRIRETKASTETTKSRLASLGRLLLAPKTSNPAPPRPTHDVQLDGIAGQTAMIRAEVQAGVLSPTLLRARATSDEEVVLVRKEIRQGSEVDEKWRPGAS